jgi:hypothetical protein
VELPGKSDLKLGVEVRRRRAWRNGAEEADAPSEEEDAAKAGKGALRTGTLYPNSLAISKSASGHPNSDGSGGHSRKRGKVDHLWTQVVHLDSTSLVAIDTVVSNSGSLFSDFLPPVNPRTSTDELTNQRASGRIREDLDAQKLRVGRRCTARFRSCVPVAHRCESKTRGDYDRDGYDWEVNFDR